MARTSRNDLPLAAWPSVKLVDDRAGNQFKAIIPRVGAG
jgi:hypothetical protein